MKEETGNRVPRISDGLLERALRRRGAPYVAVDQAKRAIFRHAGVESFDFIVYQDDGPPLLVKIGPRNDHSVAKLLDWGRVFGADFLPVFARTRPGGRIAFVAAETGQDVTTNLELAWTGALNGRKS